MEETKEIEEKIETENMEKGVEKIKEQSRPKQIEIRKDKFWKTVSIIIGILLIISLYFNFSGKPPNETGNKISINKAADEAVSYINNYLLQPGTSATLKSKTDAGDLYNLQIDIGGRSYDSYVTKDGRLLFTSAVDLTEVPDTQPSQPAETARLDISIDDDTVKGDKNAPVTIIEFSDFECPFCARFYENTLPQIIKEYVETGKVKFVYRDFPLSFHRNAQKAAEAAECAGEQGRYYEMHDKLFEEGVSGGVDSFKQYATDLSLDTAKFNDCLDSGKMEAEVQKDFSDGQKAGVSGTPAFFIDGIPLSGAQPFEAFKQVIEAELAK